MDRNFLEPTPPEVLKSRLAAIVENSDDAIVSKDLNGIIQSWNLAAQRIFGYTAEEAIGRSITMLVPPERHTEEPEILERLKRGERVDHFETIRMTRDGRRINVSVTISPIRNAAGQVVGASKIARDITLLRRVLEEGERLLMSEQSARREAERSNRIKDEFLATLGHELRTPLNAILGWAQILRSARSAGPEELAEGLETIERNARIQAQLVDELLDMSRIISGKVRLDVQRVNLEDVIDASIASVRPAADAKEIRIFPVLDEGAGLVRGDPDRLQQVIWNLLTNAVKYTPRGGRVHVYMQRVLTHVEITVTDTGQGIPPEFLPRLFTRFSQADASTTRRQGGLGLGLSIVKHLVELHGGDIRASSPGENQGSTFIVSLPIAPIVNEPAAPTARAPIPAAAPPCLIDLSGTAVLVVDDEADSRLLIKRVLESNNARVSMAASVREAMKSLSGDLPDLILSDIGMPDEDGYQLIQRVRQLPPEEGGNIPAVALTAFARPEDRRRALLAGFQMHLPKPVEASELIAVVASLTGVVQRQALAQDQRARTSSPPRRP